MLAGQIKCSNAVDILLQFLSDHQADNVNFNYLYKGQLQSTYKMDANPESTLYYNNDIYIDNNKHKLEKLYIHVIISLSVL